jgi:hypothetical protein
VERHDEPSVAQKRDFLPDVLPLHSEPVRDFRDVLLWTQRQVHIRTSCPSPEELTKFLVTPLRDLRVLRRVGEDANHLFHEITDSPDLLVDRIPVLARWRSFGHG